jgi:long-chain acyl-CoA synthetase
MTAAASATIDWRGRQPSRLIEMIRRQAALHPDAPALSEPGRGPVGYRALEAAIDAAAERLAGLGVGPGDRVLIVNENSIAAVALLFAASARDAWPVPVNARSSAREIDEIAAHCEPRRILFTSAVSREAAAHADRHGAVPLDLGRVGGVRAGPPGDGAPEPVSGDPARDVAVMIYTSGTTGRPKGVMLSHRAALYVASSPGSQLPTSPDDVIYGALPITHVYGLTSTCLRGLYGGAHVLMVPRFDVADLADALAHRGVTVFQGVPQMYARLLDHVRASGRPLEAPRLKVATIGGAAVDPALKAAAEDALGVRLVVGYGMTEFASTVTRSLPAHAGRDTCAGPTLPGIETRVVDPQGENVPPGAPGELWIRGPNRMLGYYRDPEATAAVITPDGWYRTGDLCRVDADGYVHFVERDREVIIRSGFNVYPVEVETVLASHPDVVLAAVVGRTVAGNEEVVAFVEPVAGRTPDPAALAAWCADRLAPYKRPAEIVVMDALPAAPTGKLLKKPLRELAAKRAAARAGAQPA